MGRGGREAERTGDEVESSDLAGDGCSVDDEGGDKEVHHLTRGISNSKARKMEKDVRQQQHQRAPARTPSRARSFPSSTSSSAACIRTSVVRACPACPSSRVLARNLPPSRRSKCRRCPARFKSARNVRGAGEAYFVGELGCGGRLAVFRVEEHPEEVVRR